MRAWRMHARARSVLLPIKGEHARIASKQLARAT